MLEPRWSPVRGRDKHPPDLCLFSPRVLPLSSKTDSLYCLITDHEEYFNHITRLKLFRYIPNVIDTDTNTERLTCSWDINLPESSQQL